MKILILSQHYSPEDVSGAILGVELAEGLVKLGFQINYLTCVPNYPLGKVYPGYKNSLFSKKIENEVNVVRVWSFISKKTFWRRILNYGTFSFFSLFGGIFSGKPDLILSFSPPLPLGLSAWLLSKIWNIPWILNVMDIYPEIAIVTGVLKNSLVIKIFEKLELFLYKKATLVQVLSEGFKNNLLKKKVPSEKISIIPVWSDPEKITPGIKENLFRKAHNLSGKFIILYSGNIGINSSLEDLILAAEILLESQNIVFLLVGEGTKKKELEFLVNNKNLSNVFFLPYQPRDIYNSLLAASDIGVISLEAKAYQTSLPSKTFNIMASSRPILAITPVDSEISKLVLDNNCGVVIPPGNPERIANILVKMLSDKKNLDFMGNNGRKLIETRFSLNFCLELYMNDFSNIFQKSSNGN